MDPSIHFLTDDGSGSLESATIHTLNANASPSEPNVDDKIGFTLDVAMRLDFERDAEATPMAVVTEIAVSTDQDLADSA